jgi:hypothetical protein
MTTNDDQVIPRDWGIGTREELAERGFAVRYTTTRDGLCLAVDTMCVRCGWGNWTGGDSDGVAPLIAESIDGHERHCPGAEGDWAIRHRSDGRWEGSIEYGTGRQHIVYGETRAEVLEGLQATTLEVDRAEA